MTWHQWHHTAPISRRIGLSSDSARAKAESPHSCQSIGWCAAERRYGLAESFKRFSGLDDTKNPFSFQNAGKKRCSCDSASKCGEEKPAVAQATARYRRAQDRAGQAACAQQIPHPAGDKN